MARTKTSTRDDTKTLTTSWRNKHLENEIVYKHKTIYLLITIIFYILINSGLDRLVDLEHV